MILRALAQSLAQLKNVLTEIGLFHESVGPQLLHQVVFQHDLSVARGQHQKEIERLRRQRNGLLVAQQEALLGIQPERTKLQ